MTTPSTSAIILIILSYLSLPFVWSLRLILFLFNQISPSRLTSSPLEAAKTFKKTFRREFGERMPDFFEGSYTEAVEKARRELRGVVVVLVRDGETTVQFAIETLCDGDFLEFLDRKSLLIWGGNVKESVRVY